MFGSIAKLLARGAKGQDARRMAGQFVKQALIPQGKDKTRNVIEGLVSYAPEPLYAAMQMAALPDGTPVSDRLLVGLEDLGIGMLASGAGRVTGATLARGLPQKYSAVAEGAGFLGDVGANVAINFAPRPQVNRIYEQLGTDQAVAAEAQQQLREQELVQQLLQSGLLTAEGVRALS